MTRIAKFLGFSKPSKDFSNQDLTHLDGEEQDFSDATFVNSKLVGANFKGAKLHNVNFEEADLSGATFENASLDNVNLTHAKFYDVNMTNTLVENIHFDCMFAQFCGMEVLLSSLHDKVSHPQKVSKEDSDMKEIFDDVYAPNPEELDDDDEDDFAMKDRQFKLYKINFRSRDLLTRPIEARPYIPGEVLSSIRNTNEFNCMEDRGMIARDPKDKDDQWYINNNYFFDNFIEVEQKEADKDV